MRVVIETKHVDRFLKLIGDENGNYFVEETEKTRQDSYTLTTLSCPLGSTEKQAKRFKEYGDCIESKKKIKKLKKSFKKEAEQ